MLELLASGYGPQGLQLVFHLFQVSGFQDQQGVAAKEASVPTSARRAVIMRVTSSSIHFSKRFAETQSHSNAGPRNQALTAGYAETGKSCFPTSSTSKVALAPAAFAASHTCCARGRDLALLETMR